MRQQGIESLEGTLHKSRRKYFGIRSPNYLSGRFRVTGPNRVWVGDMTFLRTRTGFLHLSILLDLYSRRIVGWAVGARPNSKLALSALGMALLQRLPNSGLIHHTDRGSPYCSNLYQECLKTNNVISSMGAAYTPKDNAVAEAFFRTLKYELVNHARLMPAATSKTALFEYIEIFYNRQRRHGALGNISPMEFEERSGQFFVVL